jgi:hypothetical protein
MKNSSNVKFSNFEKIFTTSNERVICRKRENNGVTQAMLQYTRIIGGKGEI